MLDFDGTFSRISRQVFINKLATRIIELNDNSCNDYSGNYDDFQQYKQEDFSAFDNGTKDSRYLLQAGTYSDKEERSRKKEAGEATKGNRKGD